jgi:uncharacterized lipoprotein YddW (UPF0748 family)
MKKSLAIIFLSSFIACSQVDNLTSTTNPRTSGLYQNDWNNEVLSDEVRGVWITNIDSEVMFSKKATAEAIDYLADRGYNVVFPVVWNDGYTLFPSRTMEKYFGAQYKIDTLFAKQGRDPLAELIIEGHRRGLEVIPWYEFGFSSSINQAGGHILKKYPNWSAKGPDGSLLTKNGFEWMNAFDPEVQSFITELVMEIPQYYDVDGVQGDDRLPSLPSHGGYEPYTISLYTTETGKDVPNDPLEPDFLKWKADRLSAYGKSLFETVKAYDPTLIVSYSPIIYPWGYNNYLQDWPAWVKGGYVDLLIPQAYRYDINQYKETVDEIISYAIQPDAKPYTLAMGILTKSGPRYNGPQYVKNAIRYNRTKGSSGEVYFFYEGMNHNNEHLADTLFSSFYAKPATLPYRNGEVRRKPALILNEKEALFTGEWSKVSSDNAFDGEYQWGTGKAEFVFKDTESARYEVYVHFPYELNLEQSPKVELGFGNHTDGEFFNKPLTGKLEGWVLAGEVIASQSDWVKVGISGTTLIPVDGVMMLKKLNKKK